jgi:hypothetical protein
LERHGFEYFRHRTLSLYAALDTLRGEVYGNTVSRHTSDLSRKIMRYSRRYNRDARPIRWSYSDRSRRIQPASDSPVTGH